MQILLQENPLYQKYIWLQKPINTMQTDVLLVTYTVLLPTNPCCSITELLRHPASRAFLSLVRFWCIPKRNGVRSLWSMPSIFLGYSFEPKRSSHSLTTVGSVMTIGLSINRCLHPKKQV